MHPLLEKIQGSPPMRALITHLKTCENGCSVGLAVSYCPEAVEIAKPPALAAFSAAVEALAGPPARNPLAGFLP